MPFFRLITPFSCFYRWFLRQNGVYMQKVPWFFKLKLCRGPGPAGVSHRNTETGTHTHTSHHHHWRLCFKINLRILGTHCRHVSNVWLSASADMQAMYRSSGLFYHCALHSSQFTHIIHCPGRWGAGTEHWGGIQHSATTATETTATTSGPSLEVTDRLTTFKRRKFSSLSNKLFWNTLYLQDASNDVRYVYKN